MLPPVWPVEVEALIWPPPSSVIKPEIARLIAPPLPVAPDGPALEVKMPVGAVVDVPSMASAAAFRLTVPAVPVPVVPEEI
jgi:hypothetical protein